MLSIAPHSGRRRRKKLVRYVSQLRLEFKRYWRTYIKRKIEDKAKTEGLLCHSPLRTWGGECMVLQKIQDQYS